MFQKTGQWLLRILVCTQYCCCVYHRYTCLFGCLVISVEAVDVNDDRPPSNVLWPTQEILEEVEIFKGSAPSAFVMIPASLIQLRGMSSGQAYMLL